MIRILQNEKSDLKSYPVLNIWDPHLCFDIKNGTRDAPDGYPANFKAACGMFCHFRYLWQINFGKKYILTLFTNSYFRNKAHLRFTVKEIF